MKKKVKILLLFFCCIALECTSSPDEENNIYSKGLLVSKVDDIYYLSQDIILIDKNGTETPIITRNSNGELELSINDKLTIRALYLNYDIIIFDARHSDGGFEVLVNNKWTKIKDNSSLVYQEWEEFIKKAYIGLTQESPLKHSKDLNSKTINDYQKYKYEVVNVEGDWLQLRCLRDCESCPREGIVSGWVRWRNKGRLLVELYYLC